MEATRDWREGVRDEIEGRQRLFKQLVDRVDGWEVSTGGGYFAYASLGFEESMRRREAS